MYQNRTAVLTRVFYAAFALCFAWVLLCSVFANTAYPKYNPAASLALLVLFGVLLWLLYRLFLRTCGFWRRRGGLVCAGAVLLTGALQLAVGFAVRYDTGGDLWAIFFGGITLAKHGSLEPYETLMSYFHMFPNNTGGAYLLGLLFRLAQRVGITDFYAVALVCNVVGLQAAMVLCWDVLRRTGGPAAAALGLVCFALFPPFYAMGAVFYTDVLSVAPPILALDLFLAARGRSGPGKRAGLYALLGAAVALGALVKFTVAIALVAAVIATLVAPGRCARRFVWDILLPCLAGVAAFALVFAGCRAYMHGSSLDKQRVERESMPLTHWIAMGLIDDGAYNWYEYEDAKAQPSRTARNEVNRDLIKSRLTQPGAQELAKLFTRKALRCFGDGTYDLSSFLDDGPHRRAPVHELMLEDGRHHRLYSHLSQGMYLAFLALALVGPVLAVPARPKGGRALRLPMPWLCMFGLLLFLLLWETASRYTLNFLPVLVVCTCLGAAWLPPCGRARAR